MINKNYEKLKMGFISDVIILQAKRAENSFK